jgi:predicted ATPase
VAQLVADTLYRPLKAVAPLARLVHARTAGNPFFTIQFLATLHKEGLFAYDAGAGHWQWDLEEIRTQGLSDNVAELMVAKLKRLPTATQQALMLAACIGSTVEVPTLVLAGACPETRLQTDLQEAVAAGLLLNHDGAYHFLHDRVREAAYGLIPEKERVARHLQIGRRLFSKRLFENCLVWSSSRRKKNLTGGIHLVF